MDADRIQQTMVDKYSIFINALVIDTFLDWFSTGLMSIKLRIKLSIKLSIELSIKLSIKLSIILSIKLS